MGLGTTEVLILICLLLLVALWVRSVMRRGALANARERQERAARREISEGSVPVASREPPQQQSSQQPVHVHSVSVERIVERQVLVTRCRFCTKLTPVDLTACAECGAKL